MDEQKEAEEQEKPENTEDNSDEGNKPQEPSVLTRGAAIAERLEKALKEAETTTAKLQELAAIKALGGETDGAKKQEKQEEDPTEYSKKVLQGKLDK